MILAAVRVTVVVRHARHRAQHGAATQAAVAEREAGDGTEVDAAAVRRAVHLQLRARRVDEPLAHDRVPVLQVRAAETVQYNSHATHRSTLQNNAAELCIVTSEIYQIP